MFVARTLITIGAVDALCARGLPPAVARDGDGGPKRTVGPPTTLIPRGTGEIAPRGVR